MNISEPEELYAKGKVQGRYQGYASVITDFLRVNFGEGAIDESLINAVNTLPDFEQLVNTGTKILQCKTAAEATVVLKECSSTSLLPSETPNDPVNEQLDESEKPESIYIAAVALNITPLKHEENKERILKAMRHVRAQKADIKILFLPQLSLTGTDCQDMFLSDCLEAEAKKLFSELKRYTDGILVSFGMPLTLNGIRTKATLFVGDDNIVAVHFAQNLQNDGIHYDSRWFSPWTNNTEEESFVLFGQKTTVNDKFFTWRGYNIYLEENPLAPIEDTSEMRSGIILYLDSLPFEMEQYEILRGNLCDISKNTESVVVYSNWLGNQAGEQIYDGGAMIASNGKVVAQCPRFSYNNMEIAEAVFLKKDWIAALELLTTETTNSDFEFAAWEQSSYTAFEEFSRAVPLALFDYMRKSRSCGFTLSLSGGADSGSIAILIRFMVHFGRKSPEFLKKLEYIPGFADYHPTNETPDEEIVAKLLSTVYQSTCNSSQVTRNASRTIAEYVGSVHYEFEIDPIVESYKAMVEKNTGRQLTWEKDDLALQNIQARTRAPSAWLLANLEGRILLATGNRSEAACGYATMDGDTCGGLAPIGGIDKATLRQWLRWLETVGMESFGTIPELKCINEQQPTAELRPASEHQTDEGDLMPYEILDLFEQALIAESFSRDEAIAFVKESADSLGISCDSEQLYNWYRKFCVRWSNSQWKRQREAPCFHVDSRNLSPDSWCRFPILSGGLLEED